MALQQISSASALQDVLQSNKNVCVTFSAHWCGPCKKSKPQLEALAEQYQADATVDLQMAIAYESDLGNDIHNYNVRAFPTYVLYQNATETNRVEGANLQAVQQMIVNGNCQKVLTGGNALGGGGGSGSGGAALSLAEARALRLAKFGGGSAAPAPAAAPPQEKACEPTPMETEEAPHKKDADEKEGATADADVSMEIVHDEDKEAEPEMVDPTEKLNKELLQTLTESMGFSLLRAQKGLLNGNETVEGAVEWLMLHQDDTDIDEPIALVATVAQSYKCNECGKILANMANLELHANKTGHSDFEESTKAVKPLTAEEKVAKVAEIKELLRVKRAEREEAEKVDDVEREIQRRNMGKEMAKTREQMDAEQRKREALVRKREKEAFKNERARLRAELAKDKAERAANKGVLSSRLGVDGYNPDGIQYDVPADAAEGGQGGGGGDGVGAVEHKQKKVKANSAKIDDYIAKVSAYRAGGDGGKCLKVLKAYVGNLVDNPNESKFRTINMENKAFKTKVKPFIGAKHLLLAVGFAPPKGGDNTTLVLDDDKVDAALLADTKAKLEAALVKY